MEVQEGYRGKIKYLYGRELEERPKSDCVIGIAGREKEGGEVSRLPLTPPHLITPQEAHAPFPVIRPKYGQQPLMNHPPSKTALDVFVSEEDLQEHFPSIIADVIDPSQSGR